MANPIHLLNPLGGAEYTAGDGISIQNDEISVKVDGSTVTVNGEGELVAHAPNELPEFSSSDANKVLKVDSQGEELEWSAVSPSLPTAAIYRRVNGNGYHLNTQEEQEATRGSRKSTWIAQAEFDFEVNTTDNINSTYVDGTPVKVQVWTIGDGTRTIISDTVSLYSVVSASYPNSTFYHGTTGMHIYDWDTGNSMTSYDVRVYMPDGTQISFSPHGVVIMSVYRLGFYP